MVWRADTVLVLVLPACLSDFAAEQLASFLSSISYFMHGNPGSHTSLCAHIDTAQCASQLTLFLLTRVLHPREFTAFSLTYPNMNDGLLFWYQEQFFFANLITDEVADCLKGNEKDVIKQKVQQLDGSFEAGFAHAFAGTP
jgi:hypothetical protein